MIVAVASNGVIGKGKELAWHIKSDLRRFRVMTDGKTVVVGRTTFEQLRQAYESRGKALPDRNHVVLTADPNYKIELPKCFVCHNVTDALEIAKTIEKDEIFVAGGATIFKQILPLVERLYITKVDLEVEGDAFFPDYAEFKKVIMDEAHEEQGIKFRYLTLERVGD